jgi:hypothetical protein
LPEAAQNFELLSNIQDQKLKIKTYSGCCPFKGLSNDTTLMQIQSGRTVPLKGPKHEIFVAGIFKQISPVWVGDFGTRPKIEKKFMNRAFLYSYIEKKLF